MFLTPHPKLLFAFLWVTGLHALLSFISVFFSKSSAEPPAKRGQPPSGKGTHTSNSLALRESLKALLPIEALWGLKAGNFMSKQEWLSLENLKALHRKASDASPSRLRPSFCTAVCPVKSAPSWVGQMIPPAISDD